MPAKIEDYALVGNGYSACLISRTGSVDWLCWPRFDSDACFAALLGDSSHGCWELAPVSSDYSVSRCYDGDTLILKTHYELATGTAVVTDFMPTDSSDHQLIRTVECVKGTVNLATRFLLRFGYGQSVPWVSRLEGEEGITAVSGPDRVTLRSSIELQNKGMQTAASFTVSEGERHTFTMQYTSSYDVLPEKSDVCDLLKKTITSWNNWSVKTRAHGKYRDIIHRSLITLRAMAFEPTGGIVAALTTSLPEKIGGSRNWDYRFCWLRDATLTIRTLMRGGYFEEASRWRDWLVRSVAGAPEEIQIMYSITGRRRLMEWTCNWLPGYEGSSPVRIGNAAADQLQLDVYGEIMNALYEARKGGLPDDSAAWSVQLALISHLIGIWKEPDEGIWETRGGRQHFTYSKVMCWVALDRAIKSVEEFGLSGDLPLWRAVRQEMHTDICLHGFNTQKNSFVQQYGGDALDASLLQLAIVGFLPVTDPRIQGTITAVEKELEMNGFVMRYRTDKMDDGLQQSEGSFLACSFWLVENMSLQGRYAEAEALFDRLLAVQNDVGLFSEEYDPVGKRMLGNFPQAFSHLALVETAFNLLERQNGSTSQ